jgi:medium-chain acyl-[acyl-carrier-protein] hydrolase
MPTSSALEVWLPYRKPILAAQTRLVCLPFAGGGASAFRSWARELPSTIEVCAVQPPGHETRFRDPPFTRLQSYVAALADVLTPLFDRPVAFFGHSMGALTGFELARELRRRGGPAPTRLIVSGRAAPHLPPRRNPLHTLPDREFRDELKHLGGTPAAVIDNDELMAVFLPVLRADFTAHETYHLIEEPPLDCPMLAVTGASDMVASPADVDEWRRHTVGPFLMQVFAGDHFYLQTHRSPLLHRIARFLEPSS